YVTDAPRVGREVDAGRAVIEFSFFYRNSPRLRPCKPRDQVEDRGLAGAGAAEERGDAAAGGERGIEREAADAAAHVELKHRGRRRAPWRGAPGSRKPSAPRARGRWRGCTGAAPGRRPRAPA